MSSITTTPTGSPPAPPPGAGRPPVVRILWRALGSLAAACLLVSGAYQIVVALAHEEHTVHRQFAAAGVTSIEVRNAADGSVHISGGGRDDGTIDLTARVSHGLRRTGHHERVEDGRLILDSTCPAFGSSFCGVSYTIQAPPGVDVLVESDSGSITVEEIAGDVDISVDSGSIALSGIGGSIRSSADSGRIDAVGLTSGTVAASTDSGGISLDFDRAPGSVRAEADSGSVTVLVPEDGHAYLVETDTDSGGEQVAVSTDPASDSSIVARTDSGNVTVAYSDSG